MDPADIRAFVARDWKRLNSHKMRAWGRTKTTHGVTAAVRAAESLRLSARARDPGWPSDADRRADFEAHVRVSRALRLVPRP